MKKIILAYGDDNFSKAALEETRSIQLTFQNELSQKNIQLIFITDEGEYLEDLKLDIKIFPTLLVYNQEDYIEIQGYNIENQFNYLKTIINMFNIKNDKIFYGWAFNKKSLVWEPPIPKPRYKKAEWDDYEERWLSSDNIQQKKRMLKPFDSWVWDRERYFWQPPVKRPKDNYLYSWDEETRSWKQLPKGE